MPPRAHCPCRLARDGSQASQVATRPRRWLSSLGLPRHASSTLWRTAGRHSGRLFVFATMGSSHIVDARLCGRHGAALASHHGRHCGARLAFSPGRHPLSGRHVVISPLVVDTEVANCGRQQLTFGLLLACLWLASGGLGHPSSDSSTSGPMPWRRRVGELSLWASRCILSCTWPQWRSAHVGRPLPCRTSTVPALPALQSTLRRHAAAL